MIKTIHRFFRDFFFLISVSIASFLIPTNIFPETGGEILRLYLDADFVGTRQSGISIERGIRLALSEVDYMVDGFKAELVIRDHHGSSRRSRIHLEEYLADPRALAVFCGLHSPPVLANLDFINEKGILLLDPWAAAGPITRSTDSSGLNWVFRLSVDDTKAGKVLVSDAIDFEGFSRPALLLEETGWGKSNQKTITNALATRGIVPSEVIWFNWKIGKIGAREILSDIHSSGADVIFFVANAPEGKTFVKAMADREKDERLPIRSHWGITGGDFFEALGPDILTRDVDLQFIQTKFSFLNENQTAFSLSVFDKARNMYPDIAKPSDIKAPCGFIHAYDMTRILIAAIHQSDLSSNMVDNRHVVRSNLEKLKAPVKGLMKTYSLPFCPFSPDNPDAHEALRIGDFCLARYITNGGIKLVGVVKKR